MLGCEDDNLYLFSLHSVASKIVLTFQVFVDPVIVTRSTLYNK